MDYVIFNQLYIRLIGLVSTFVRYSNKELCTQTTKYSPHSFVYNCLVLSDGVCYKQFISYLTPRCVNDLSIP